MPWARAILHADLDAFFASVEQLDDPELRGRPVLVGGKGPRGVVAAASYEARAFGCHSAQPTAAALRNCPHAVVVNPRGGRYRELSDAVFEILASYTPLVQPISIDEAFLDVTGSQRLFGEPEAIAREIRERVKSDTGLTISVGVASNKFLAKLASDMDKPDGLVVIEPGREQSVLDPLPASRIFGIGPAAMRRLERLGIHTIAELRGVPPGSLTAALGSFGQRVHELAQGIDERPVHTDREAKSISHEQTFGVNAEDPEFVRAVLMTQAEDVARRVRRHDRLAGGVTVKIRYGQFETVTRSATLGTPTDRTEAIWEAARGLFDAWPFRPVRLIGVAAAKLSEGSGEQLDLFERRERARAVDSATDAIVDRFGKGSIRRARALPAKRDRKTDEGDAARYGPEG